MYGTVFVEKTNLCLEGHMKATTKIALTAIALTVSSFATFAHAEDSPRVKNMSAEIEKLKLEAELEFLPNKIENRQVSDQDVFEAIGDAVAIGIVSKTQFEAASENTERILQCVITQSTDEAARNEYKYMEKYQARETIAETVFMRCTPRKLDIASKIKVAFVKQKYLETLLDPKS
jgi:hypothetical protein